MPARNMLVQLLALYTVHESHNAQRYRQTDGQTDGRQADANSRSYRVAVRSARNIKARVSVACSKAMVRRRPVILSSVALSQHFIENSPSAAARMHGHATHALWKRSARCVWPCGRKRYLAVENISAENFRLNIRGWVSVSTQLQFLVS